MQFFSETFKMDFISSTSLKCFAVSGFHPPPVKQDAEDLPLNSTLHSLLSPVLQMLSLGTSQSQHKEWSPEGAVCWQEGYHRPKAAASRSLTRDSEGTVPAMSLLCAGGPFPPHLGDSGEIVWVPWRQLITELSSTIPHRFRFPIIASCWGEVPLCKVTAQILSLATRSHVYTPA